MREEKKGEREARTRVRAFVCLFGSEVSSDLSG